MCRDIFAFLKNNTKLDWLELKKPNPYAMNFDKLSIILPILGIGPILITMLLITKVQCIASILIISFAVGILGFIRRIKTVPADSEQVFIKQVMCIQLIITTLLLIASIVYGVQCLTT